MSIVVDLADLPDVLASFGTGYLLTTDGTGVKAVHVAPDPAAGRLRLQTPGRGSLANVAANPRVTLVWPPRSTPGFSLIVDAEAVLDPAAPSDLVAVPVSAVLHRPVAESDDTAGRPFWVSAFLDVDAAHRETVPAFWAAVSGHRLSPPRGDADEFATLVPPTGHDHLRVQRVDDPGTGAPTRIHLDLHVPDPARAADRAVALGAEVVHRSPHGYVVLRSPGGLVFCCVAHAACLRAPAATWSDGSSSAVDQVCIDAPAHLVDAERRFWADLTGWAPQASSVSTAFSSLRRPEGQPIRLLLQRVEDDRPAVTAHLDVACSDRAAETARHRALGAELVAERERWTVLRDPSGAAYCLTDRDPVTGVL
ncbi:VOC family protein [Nocardioides zeae]|nr:VOC family protein [Nocardioides zeae]